MKAPIHQIVSQGKEAIIQMALAIIEEKLPIHEISPEDYAITVWTNGKEVEVRFYRLIRYKQKGTHHRYDISVAVLTKRIYPFDDWGERADFFVPTPAQQETIDYLTKLMGLPVRGMENEIYEDEENYHITFYSKGGHTTHIIDKKTRERLEPLDITYMVFPSDDALVPDLFPSDDQDNWREILE